MKPIRLTESGEMMIIPEELGLTEQSELSVGGVLGRHEWQGCFSGQIEFHEVLGGWVVTCTFCGLRLEVPKEVRTYGALREFLLKERKR